MTWRSNWDEPPKGHFGWAGAGRAGSVTRTLVIACVVATVASMVAENLVGVRIAPWLGLRLDNAMWIYPFVTYIFVHSASDVWHLIFNMLMLWYTGRDLEDRLGKSRYLTLFFGSAFVGALLHVGLLAASRAFDMPGLFGLGSGPLVGASGAVYGLLFFVARETPDKPFFFYLVPVPARVLAIICLILEVLPLLLGSRDGVAHLCHLGGAAFGWLWFAHRFDAFRAVSRAEKWRRRRSEERAQQRAADDDAEMDRLLEKIHGQGLSSLSASERRFLDERSRELRGPRR